MKVVIVSGHWQGGGAEAVAGELFGYLEKHGVECYFLYACGKAPQKKNIIKCGPEWEHYAHAAEARILDRDGRGSVITTKRLISEIKRLEPDVVNLHNLVCYSFHVPMLLSFLNEQKIRVVWTLHDCWTFTGHCISFEGIGCNKWKTGCGNCPGKKEYPRSLLFDRSRKNLKEKKVLIGKMERLTLVTPSHWLQDTVSKTFLSKFPVKVIPNGIDCGIFSPQASQLRERYHIAPDQTVLLCLTSRWTKSKGLRYISELAEMPETRNWRIVLIGNTRKDHNVVSDRILAIPRTENRQELAAWYSLADVFVNPSVADNFPTVNLEALACGTPVVTFPAGGSGEAAGNVTGVVAKEISAAALREAIVTCLERNIRPEDCRQRALLFSSEQCYQQYLDLFEKVVTQTKE